METSMETGIVTTGIAKMIRIDTNSSTGVRVVSMSSLVAGRTKGTRTEARESQTLHLLVRQAKGRIKADLKMLRVSGRKARWVVTR